MVRSKQACTVVSLWERLVFTDRGGCVHWCMMMSEGTVAFLEKNSAVDYKKNSQPDCQNRRDWNKNSLWTIKKTPGPAWPSLAGTEPGLSSPVDTTHQTMALEPWEAKGK